MKSEGMTVYEIYLRNGGCYPFWITSWQPVHYVALVRNFGYRRNQLWWSCDVNEPRNREHPGNGFLCDLYTLDKQRCEKRAVFIPGHNLKDWRPA